jgi:hypothetical protein
MDILTRERASDWKAWLADNPKVWEAGKTEAEAVGKLIISASSIIGVTVIREEK